MIKRVGVQFVGFALLLIPATILGFADELGAYFQGARAYVGSVTEPRTNGIGYLAITAGLAVIVRLAVGAYSLRNRRASPDRRFTEPGDPFGSRPVLVVTSGAFIAVLFALIFGYLAIGVSTPASRVPNVEHIRQRAEDLFGRFPVNEPIEAFSLSGFAVSTYEVRTVPSPSPAASNTWEWKGGTFEEYGFPIRCLRSPIDIGIPRPGIHRLFFDPTVDHFIWMQLTNIRLLPFGFGVNAAFFTFALWLVCAGPGLVYESIRRRRLAQRGRCLNCGYILHGLQRCPECGHTADARSKGA